LAYSGKRLSKTANIASMLTNVKKKKSASAMAHAYNSQLLGRLRLRRLQFKASHASHQ
jgi:hypothetical protein